MNNFLIYHEYKNMKTKITAHFKTYTSNISQGEKSLFTKSQPFE